LPAFAHRTRLGGKQPVSGVRREPAGEQCQAPAQLRGRQVIRTFPDAHIVPQGMHVLGGGGSEGSQTVLLQALRAACVPGQHLLLRFYRRFVDLAADALPNFRFEQPPVCRTFSRRKLVPQHLAETR